MHVVLIILLRCIESRYLEGYADGGGPAFAGVGKGFARNGDVL